MASSMAHLALPRSSISRTITSRSRSRRLARGSGSSLSYSTIPAVPVSSLSPPESAVPPSPRRLPPSTQLHIPAPASLVEGGVTRLYVNVATGVPGLLHSLAVIRAIEQRFGPVVDVSQTRFSDTGILKPFLFVDLLHPIPPQTFDSAENKEIVLEVPLARSPSSHPTSGGPSLDEVASVLSSTSLSSGSGVTNQSTHEMILMSIAPSDPELRPQWVYKRAVRPRPNARSREAQEEEDEQIAAALAGFGGFNGGFEPLRRTYSALAEGERRGPAQEEEGEKEVQEAKEEETQEPTMDPNEVVELWKARRAAAVKRSAEREAAAGTAPIAQSAQAAEPEAKPAQAAVPPPQEEASTRRIWTLFGPSIPAGSAAPSSSTVEPASTPSVAQPTPAPQPPASYAQSAAKTPINTSSSPQRVPLPPGRTGQQRRAWYRERQAHSQDQEQRAGAVRGGRSYGLRDRNAPARAEQSADGQEGGGLIGALGSLKHWAIGRSGERSKR